MPLFLDWGSLHFSRVVLYFARKLDLSIWQLFSLSYYCWTLLINSSYTSSSLITNFDLEATLFFTSMCHHILLRMAQKDYPRFDLMFNCMLNVLNQWLTVGSMPRHPVYSNYLHCQLMKIHSSHSKWSASSFSAD